MAKKKVKSAGDRATSLSRRAKTISGGQGGMAPGKAPKTPARTKVSAPKTPAGVGRKALPPGSADAVLKSMGRKPRKAKLRRKF